MTEFEKKIKGKFADNNIKTLSEFCEKVGISHTSIRDIFKREDCKVSFLLKMCEVLNCKANDLLY